MDDATTLSTIEIDGIHYRVVDSTFPTTPGFENLREAYAKRGIKDRVNALRPPFDRNQHVQLYLMADGSATLADSRIDSAVVREAGTTLPQPRIFNAGEMVTFTPNAKDGIPITGMVRELIHNTSNARGYHIYAPTATDPHRVLRVWEANGILTPAPSEAVGSVYESTHKGEPVWMVQTSEKRGFGDWIFHSKEEADTAGVREKQRNEERAKRHQEQEEAKQRQIQADLETAAKESDIRKFVSKDSALQQGRKLATLRTTYSTKYGVKPLWEFIADVVAEGYTVTTEQVRDEPAVRRLQGEFERLRRSAPTGNEKHPETIRLAEVRRQLAEGGPFRIEKHLERDDSVFSEKAISKTGMDFAEYLIAKLRMNHAQGENQDTLETIPQINSSVVFAAQTHLRNGGEIQIPGNPSRILRKANADDLFLSPGGRGVRIKIGSQTFALSLEDVRSIGAQAGRPVSLDSIDYEIEPPKPDSPLEQYDLPQARESATARLAALVGGNANAGDEVRLITGIDFFDAPALLIDLVADSAALRNGEAIDTQAKLAAAQEAAKALLNAEYNTPKEKAAATEIARIIASISVTNHDSAKKKSASMNIPNNGEDFNKRHTLDLNDVKTGAWQATLSKKAFSDSPSGLWRSQTQAGHLAFNATVKWEGKKTASPNEIKQYEIYKAAIEAGFKYTNYRASGYGTIWVLEKDGKLLTKAGAEALLTGLFNAPTVIDTASRDADSTANYKAAALRLAEWIATLPESTLESPGAFTSKLRQTQMGDHYQLDYDRGNPFIISKTVGFRFFTPRKDFGHGESTGMKGLLFSILHIASITEDHWAIASRKADKYAIEAIDAGKNFSEVLKENGFIQQAAGWTPEIGDIVRFTEASGRTDHQARRIQHIIHSTGAISIEGFGRQHYNISNFELVRKANELETTTPEPPSAAEIRLQKTAQFLAEQINKDVRKLDYFKNCTPEQQTLALRTSEGEMPHAERILRMIDERDTLSLIDWIGGTGNPHSKKIFAQETGLSLGTNEASRHAAIRQWVGPERFDTAVENREKARAERRAIEEAQRKENALHYSRGRAEAITCQLSDGTTKNGADWIDDLIATGFDRILKIDKGAVPIYALVNEQNIGTKIKNAALSDYARKAVERRSSVEPPAPQLDSQKSSAPVNEPATDRPARTVAPLTKRWVGFLNDLSLTLNDAQRCTV